MKILEKKLIIKAIVYRILAFMIIFGITFFITNKVNISIGAGIVEFILKIALYYIYEVFWKYITIKKE